MRGGCALLIIVDSYYVLLGQVGCILETLIDFHKPSTESNTKSS